MAMRLGLLSRRIPIDWNMERNEMKMVRWMCDVRLQDRVSNAELRRRLGIKGIKEEMRISRLG